MDKIDASYEYKVLNSQLYLHLSLIENFLFRQEAQIF